MDTTPLTPFKITTDGMTTQVEVDGRDVSHQLIAVTFEAEGGPTIDHLTLHVRPQAGVIEGVAVIEQVGTSGAVGDQVRQLDPEQVRELVAARDLGFTDDPYSVMLDVVADLLDQAAEVPGG